MRPQKSFPPDTTERMEQLLKTTRSLEEYRRIQSIYFRSKYGFGAERIADTNLHSTEYELLRYFEGFNGALILV